MEVKSKHLKSSPGRTIQEIVSDHNLPSKFGPPVVLMERRGNYCPVPMDKWSKIRPKEGTRIEIGYPVHGPAIPAIGSALISAAAPTIATTVFGVTSGLAFGLAVAGITVVGALLINALIPPPSQDNERRIDDPNFALTGVQNVENRYGIYPKVLGRSRMFPPLTARGYSETVGREDIYFRGRVAFGWGPLAIEDLRIGTTPISQFEGIELEFVNVDQTQTLALSPELASITNAWRTGTEKLQLMSKDIIEDAYSVKFEENVAVVRATRTDTISASVDVTFSQGLTRYVKGNASIMYVSFTFYYRKLGETTWILATGGNQIFPGVSSALLRFTFDYVFPEEAEWELQVTRTSPTFDNDPNVLDSAFLTGIRSRRIGTLPSHDNVAEMAFRLKASEELNGRVDTLNAVVNQMGPVWNGSAWSANQLIRHPAWVFAESIKGSHLRRPVADSRIELDDLKSWADDEPHWTCDYVVSSPERTGDVLDIVCATGRAKKTLTDMKYSVIRDGAQDAIRQVFSARNSWGFRGGIAFPREIHALRCLVVSERLDWQKDEITVYADGYDENTAAEFETLDLPGIVVKTTDTTEGNAWRLGRYHLAQATLRPEKFEWNCDWESVRVTRGDKVQLVHDVPSIGIGSGRIKSIVSSGSTLTSITLDEIMDVVADSYRVTIRDQDGDRHQFTSVVGAPASTAVWTYSSGTIDATNLAVGDLVLVELLSEVTMEILITGVYPDHTGSARLTGVPASPAVLDADSGTIPAYVPVTTDPETNPNFGPPLPVVRSLVSDHTTALLERGGTLQARAMVFLEAIISREPVGKNLQLRWKKSLTNDDWQHGELQPIGIAALYTNPLEAGHTYDVEVRSIGDIGVFRSWVSAGSVLAATSDGPPPDVTGWQVVPSEGFVQMQWIDPAVFDLSHLEIRHSSSTSGAIWNASVELSKVPYPKKNESVFARPGTYMARWVDKGGNKSANYVSVVITSSQLKVANAVHTETIHPTFTGTLSNTEVNVNDELQLLADGNGDYPSSGTWTGSTAVDLGASYPVRITPIIDVVGFSLNDAMSNWVSLADLVSLAASNPDAWSIDIEVAYSTSDTTGGTDWQPLTGGDYLGRYFNFRVTLNSTQTDQTPQVSYLEFILDMPDRIESAKSVSSGTGGLSVSYSPKFNAVPAVVITPVDAPTGSYYTVTNETRSGFDVEFFNSGATSIDVTFNWVARGYGREQ